MADTADDVLLRIDEIHRRWLNGEISQEDALFEIGDLLDRAERPAEDDGCASTPPPPRTRK